MKVYQVQYLKKGEWRNVPKAKYDNEDEANRRAESCKRGFGTTRVYTYCQSIVTIR